MHQKLNAQITHSYPGFAISDTETARLIDIAVWNNKVPLFMRPGRVAWHLLEEDVSLKADSSVHYCAAKLKGVGLWNPKSSSSHFSTTLHKDGYSLEAVPPLTDVLEYLVTYPHMGINNEGEYMFAYSSPSPIGGIVHDRAHLEYWAAKRLIENGVPSIAPLAVLQYGDSLQFKGQPMGAVITLSPGVASFRISEVLFGAALERGSDPEFDAHFDAMRESLDIEGDPNDERTRLKVISKLARQAGKLIHDFSMSGMYRYSGDWGNFIYSVERNELFLVDLDSVQDIDNLPAPARPLQVLRDIASSVYRMTAKFGYPTALDKYTLNNLLEFDPIAELLRGYFIDIPEEEIKTVSRRLWNYFIPHLLLLKKNTDDIRNHWSGDRRKSYKMDHDLFNILALTSLQPLFAKTEIGKKYAADIISENDMFKKAEHFLGGRYEYFNYLMGKP